MKKKKNHQDSLPSSTTTGIDDSTESVRSLKARQPCEHKTAFQKRQAHFRFNESYHTGG